MGLEMAWGEGEPAFACERRPVAASGEGASFALSDALLFD